MTMRGFRFRGSLGLEQALISQNQNAPPPLKWHRPKSRHYGPRRTTIEKVNAKLALPKLRDPEQKP